MLTSSQLLPTQRFLDWPRAQVENIEWENKVFLSFHESLRPASRKGFRLRGCRELRACASRAPGGNRCGFGFVDIVRAARRRRFLELQVFRPGDQPSRLSALGF